MVLHSLSSWGMVIEVKECLKVFYSNSHVISGDVTWVKIYDNDIVGQVIYWKKEYNTYGGGGTVDQYLDKWKHNVNSNLNIFYIY